MPTYQYACTECGEPLEVVQKFTDDALTVCPTCGGKLRKLYNAVGIVFKGSGFYRTDSRAGSSATDPASTSKTTSEGTAGAASSESGSSKSSESTAPAKPSDTKAPDKKSAPASSSGGSGTSAA